MIDTGGASSSASLSCSVIVHGELAAAAVIRFGYYLVHGVALSAAGLEEFGALHGISSGNRHVVLVRVGRGGVDRGGGDGFSFKRKGLVFGRVPALRMTR